MQMALALARRGLGNVWPNPAVGCVIVKNGRVLGRGWTQPSGRPHAETEALARAGAAAKGATAHVTLEPCSHTGQTGPCADALIAAGIARVVAAMEDPDPRVSGRGLAKLQAAGVEVIKGKGTAEAAEINAGFVLRVTEGRPLFTLKTATTLDGRIAAPSGDSQWITGPEARMAGHMLRLEHDAIMVGSNTALADDPLLTARLPGAEPGRRPRIVVDGRLRLPIGSRLVLSAKDVPLWVITQRGHPHGRLDAFRELGAEIIEVPAAETSGVDVRETAKALAARGLTRVLMEGGGSLAASFLKADLIDRIAWFRAPTVMGGDGLPAVAGLGVTRLDELKGFERRSSRLLGLDTFELLARRRG